MRKLRFSERQIAFIPTEAAAACPRGGTTCCAGPSYRPEGPLHDLPPGKPPESEPDGGEGSEGEQRFGKVPEILAETPVASEPEEGALDRLAAGQGGDPQRPGPRLHA